MHLIRWKKNFKPIHTFLRQKKVGQMEFLEDDDEFLARDENKEFQYPIEVIAEIKRFPRYYPHNYKPMTPKEVLSELERLKDMADSASKSLETAIEVLKKHIV